MRLFVPFAIRHLAIRPPSLAARLGQDASRMRVTLLGTGTSHGVPAIACDCAVCHSTDLHDRRLRPSILLDLGEIGSRIGVEPAAVSASPTAAAVRYVLVDTGTDLRAQALAYNVRRVDAILFTHSHADHIMGLDEVRRYNMVQQSAIGCYADRRTLERSAADVLVHLRPGTALPAAVCRSCRCSRSAVRSRSAASRWCPSR